MISTENKSNAVNSQCQQRTALNPLGYRAGCLLMERIGLDQLQTAYVKACIIPTTAKKRGHRPQ